jgi:hypothetical protein
MNKGSGILFLRAGEQIPVNASSDSTVSNVPEHFTVSLRASGMSPQLVEEVPKTGPVDAIVSGRGLRHCRYEAHPQHDESGDEAPDEGARRHYWNLRH